MRILILGKDYSARKFFDLFKKNKENIVFSNIPSNENFINFNDTKDIVDFCEANEINLVLITDIDLINEGIQEAISSINISAFCPSIDAITICSSKSYAKKFMHKNKILTPKFFVAEKPQMALDYFKTTTLAQAIKPDNSTYQECPQFCETQNQIQKNANKLFANGNKRIVLEDYIEGKNISLWVISDGYSAKIIGTSAKYQNNVALFEPNFINKELKERLLQEAIMPTISALSSQDEEYIGILGFDFILTYDNKAYLLGYNHFFDELNVDFYTKGFDIDWAQVFDSTLIGDVFQKYEIKPKDDYMLTIRQNEKIHLISAKTKSNLEKYLEELDFDLSEYYEAKKIWKY
ncbi:MAG: ATP-grasp domain-containing protein [Candidatus Gastranaerophilales bacterium]|nr:ATP-grasp domain-containing protein [Candidatus Gastranaerophilales bacterium]